MGIYEFIINPYDVLMFRESRSFSAGNSYLAKSTNHFYSAVAGALRAKIYERTRDKELIGYGEEEPAFEIIGSFYAFKDVPHFFYPGDVVKVKVWEGDRYNERLCAVEPKNMKWRGRYYVTIPTGLGLNFEIKNNKLISYDSLKTHLTKPNFGLCKNGNFFENEVSLPRDEDRIGIKIGKSGTVEEGYFYRASFKRLGVGAGISVWIKADDYGEQVKEILGDGMGTIKLGGEGRFASYRLIKSSVEFNKLYAQGKNKVRFYVATPVVLEYGERDILSYLRQEIERTLNTNKIKIYAILGEKPTPISGWDMRRNRPKSTRYVIPPGTIIFGEFSEDYEVKDFVKIGKLKKLGYGLIFIGSWNGGGDA